MNCVQRTRQTRNNLQLFLGSKFKYSLQTFIRKTSDLAETFDGNGNKHSSVLAFTLPRTNSKHAQSELAFTYTCTHSFKTQRQNENLIRSLHKIQFELKNKTMQTGINYSPEQCRHRFTSFCRTTSLLTAGELTHDCSLGEPNITNMTLTIHYKFTQLIFSKEFLNKQTFIENITRIYRK